MCAIENWKLLESEGKEGKGKMIWHTKMKQERRGVWELRKENTEKESATLEEQNSQIWE